MILPCLLQLKGESKRALVHERDKRPDVVPQEDAVVKVLRVKKGTVNC